MHACMEDFSLIAGGLAWGIVKLWCDATQPPRHITHVHLLVLHASDPNVDICRLGLGIRDGVSQGSDCHFCEAFVFSILALLSLLVCSALFIWPWRCSGGFLMRDTFTPSHLRNRSMHFRGFRFASSIFFSVVIRNKLSDHYMILYSVWVVWVHRAPSSMYTPT